MSNAKALIEAAVDYDPKNGKNGYKAPTPTPETPPPNFKDEYIVDYDSDYPEPKPIISYEKNIVATSENIGMITGAAKVGKSALIERICAAFIAKEEEPVDCFGFEVKRLDGLVSYFDTERSNAAVHKAGRRIRKFAGYERFEKVDNFEFLSLKKASAEDICTFLRKYVEFEKPKVVILDGISDLLASGANDEKESITVSRMLLELSSKYDTYFICVLHTVYSNGTDKSRGHLGSELKRKCEFELTVKEDVPSGIRNIEFTLLREGGRPKAMPAFQWCDIQNGFVGCESVVKTKEKAVTKSQEIANLKPFELKRLAEKVSGMKSTDAYEEIRKILGICKSYAESAYKRLKDDGFLVECEKKWVLSEKAKTIQS